jgi:spore germination cell wall hydrolase CwlJ-like protein
MRYWHAFFLVVGLILIKLGLEPETVQRTITLPTYVPAPVPAFDEVSTGIDKGNLVPSITDATEQDRQCLALNIYFEAKNQSLRGQMAVGIVTLKRVVDDRFPNDVCGVVTHTHYRHANGFPVRHMCQFSWYCDGKPDRPIEPKAFQQAQRIASALLDPESAIVDFTHGADHYHADYIEAPVWASKLLRVTQIDNHIFYTSAL